MGEAENGGLEERVHRGPFTFVWSVDCTNWEHRKPGEYIDSAKFSSVDNNKLIWNLRIYPKGNKTDDDDWLSLYLRLSSLSDNISGRIQFTVSILDSKKVKKLSYSLTDEITRNQGQGWQKCYSRKALLAKSSEYVSNNTITIHAELNVLFDDTTTSSRLVCPQSSGLEPDLGTILYEQQKFPDVVIVVGGKQLKAHKGVLASKSTVFTAMFEHDMKEKSSNTVVIVDLTYEAVEGMLRYIYTGSVKDIGQLADLLLVAAEKYNLQNLKLLCEDELNALMTIYNAADTLVLANIQNAQRLKNNTIDFICSNINEVIATAGWNSNSKMLPSVFIEIVSHLAIRLRNECIVIE